MAVDLLRSLGSTLADRRYRRVALAVTLAYSGLWVFLIFVTSALMRGGSLPDASETRWLPVTPAQLLSLYELSPGSVWTYPLAAVEMFWQGRQPLSLRGTLIYVSLGFVVRMTLIAALGGLTVALLVALVARVRSRSRILGASTGIGVAAVGSGVGAPMAAFAGG